MSWCSRRARGARLLALEAGQELAELPGAEAALLLEPVQIGLVGEPGLVEQAAQGVERRA